MQHAYAETENGELVCIDAITRDTREDYPTLLCPACQSEMIPALGKHNRHHFRHKSEGCDTACSGESYLHMAAKKLIQKRYQQCRMSGTNYPISLSARHSCKHGASRGFPPCRLSTPQIPIDLTSYSSCELEARIEAFVVDLLFTSSSGTLAIEIAVTHEVSQEKAASGIPILEIKVSSEDDLRALDPNCESPVLSDRSLAIRDFNIPGLQPYHSGKCRRKACETVVIEFLIYPSGKTRLHRAHPWELTDPGRTPLLHQEFHSLAAAGALGNLEILDRLTRRAMYEKNINVRSCLVCRHHAISGMIEAHNPIWCAQMGKSGSSNMAAGCWGFSPFASADEIRAFRRQEENPLID